MYNRWQIGELGGLRVGLDEPEEMQSSRMVGTGGSGGDTAVSNKCSATVERLGS